MLHLPRRKLTQLLTAGSIATLIPSIGQQALSTTPQGSIRNQGDVFKDITDLFAQLPGQTAFQIKVVTPNHTWAIERQPNKPLFCGSAFKVYVLTVFLRQMEQGKVSLTDKLRVDDQVRVLSSPVFENLTGETTALIALEAMITHSDNTATDLIMAHVTPQAVRDFIHKIGLTQTLIPDSINIMFSYLLGAEDGENWGWQKIKTAIDDDTPLSRSIINNQQTMAASPHDFVKFYEQALQGAFFQQESTLKIFKRILTLPAILWDFVPPWSFGYVKGGSIDFQPQYALCLAGGINFYPEQWAYYSYLINWEDQTGEQTPIVSKQFLAAVKTSFTLVQSSLERSH